MRDSDAAGAGRRSPPVDSSTDLSSLFNYPSLGRLFDGANPQALDEMRARLARTSQDLERVIRRGTKEDADRATRAARAYSVTLGFLDALEKIRNEMAKGKS
jgi:hypothetical protein